MEEASTLKPFAAIAWDSSATSLPNARATALRVADLPSEATVIAEFGMLVGDRSPYKLVLVASHEGGQTWEIDQISTVQVPLVPTTHQNHMGSFAYLAGN